MLRILNESRFSPLIGSGGLVIARIAFTAMQGLISKHD
jgi:hypothetical protein